MGLKRSHKVSNSECLVYSKNVVKISVEMGVGLLMEESKGHPNLFPLIQSRSILRWTLFLWKEDEGWSWF